MRRREYENEQRIVRSRRAALRLALVALQVVRDDPEVTRAFEALERWYS